MLPHLYQKEHLLAHHDSVFPYIPDRVDMMQNLTLMPNWRTKGNQIKSRFGRSESGLDSVYFEDLGLEFSGKRSENSKEYRISNGETE